MGKIDIIIIIFVVLLGVIGFLRGGFNQVAKLGGWFISFIVSALFVEQTTDFISKTSLGLSLSEKLSSTIASKYPNTEIYRIFSTTSKETLISTLEESGISKFLAKIGAELINVNKIDNVLGEKVSTLVASSLAWLILSIITFIVLFIVILIVIKLVAKLLNSFANKTVVVNVINRIIGLVIGLVKGAIIVCIVLFISSVIAKYSESVNNFLVNSLKLGTDATGIGKYLYENNPLITLWNIIFKKLN